MKYTGKIQFFFQKLIRRIRYAEGKSLYRVAGLIRVTAKRTMRKRAGPSSPGTPPHVHTEMGLREIYFSVFGNHAIIGPVKFPGSNQYNEPVPHVHEFGGTYTSRFYYNHFPERPYMSVALKKLHEKGLISREFSAVMAKVL